MFGIRGEERVQFIHGFFPFPILSQKEGGLETGVAGGSLAGFFRGYGTEFTHGLGPGEGEGGILVFGFLPELGAEIGGGAYHGEDADEDQLFAVTDDGILERTVFILKDGDGDGGGIWIFGHVEEKRGN